MHMNRAYNFSAGPSAMPEEVLLRVREELLDWRGMGLSIMEMSHRSKEFIAVAEQATADFNTLLEVPKDYTTLFLQGGGSTQFAAVPLNLAAAGQTVDYVNTGYWTSKSITEAKRLAPVNIVACSREQGFSRVPPQSEWKFSDNAAYVYYTLNETIDGVEFSFIPDTGPVPLVVDASSTILSRPLDVSRFGVIFASAQKNIGPAGITVVVVRKDLFDQARPDVPATLHWLVHAANESMSNTPPTFAWYLSGLVFKWLIAKGGLKEIEKINQRKAAKLYKAIDSSDFYLNAVEHDSRSWMNVIFSLADAKFNKAFLEQSTAAGLLNLKGHRAKGGMRASIYNAVSEEAVDTLIDFMSDFERKNG